MQSAVTDEVCVCCFPVPPFANPSRKDDRFNLIMAGGLSVLLRHWKVVLPPQLEGMTI